MKQRPGNQVGTVTSNSEGKLVLARLEEPLSKAMLK